MFVRSRVDGDLEAGFAIADVLATDSDPVVHKAVGIFLKHADGVDPDRLHRILTRHAHHMPRAGLRLAVEKLTPPDRARYLARG